MGTDPRIAIVAEYLKAEGFESSEAGNYDGSLEHTAEGILSKLDAIPSPSGEELGVVEVERMAIRLFAANTEASGMGVDALKWTDLHESAREFWRKLARTALSALPPSGALGLAREINAIAGTVECGRCIKRNAAIAEKARALVAMLERREA